MKKVTWKEPQKLINSGKQPIGFNNRKKQCTQLQSLMKPLSEKVDNFVSRHKSSEHDKNGKYKEKPSHK